MVPNQHGDMTTPSVVAYLPDGQVFVGKDAVQCVGEHRNGGFSALPYRQAAQNPDNTFYSVKRFIGRDYDEVKELIPKVCALVRYCSVMTTSAPDGVRHRGG